MSDNIPLDVMAAAMRALMVPEHEMVDSVSRAILAERERCAAIVNDASRVREKFWVDGRAMKGSDETVIFISAAKIDACIDAIRNPHLPSGAAACAADTPAATLLPVAGDQSNSLPPQAHPSHKGSDSRTGFAVPSGPQSIHQNASVGDDI